jgi:hypothetical protein
MHRPKLQQLQMPARAKVNWTSIRSGMESWGGICGRLKAAESMHHPKPQQLECQKLRKQLKINAQKAESLR